MLEELEIERRWLVSAEDFRNEALADIATKESFIAQAYICSDDTTAVRIRNSDNFIYSMYIKKKVENGTKEFVFTLTFKEFEKLLNTCGKRVIIKTRYYIPFGGLVIELDEFHGALDGLMIAEIELKEEQAIVGDLPKWFGKEITNLRQFSNSSLSLLENISYLNLNEHSK